jgi:hypothetical protein
MAAHLMALVVLAAGSVASRTSAPAAECEPVVPASDQVFAEPGSITRGASIQGDLLVTTSRVAGTWYIVADVDGFVAVWVTDRDPHGDEPGSIVAANWIAQRYSSLDLVNPPLSRSETAQAAGDRNGIADAAGCVDG